MRLVGKYERKSINENNDLEIVFILTGYNYKRFCEDLLKGETYTLEIKKLKDKRSLNQNNYFWKLVNEIDIHLNGHRKNNWELYLQLLEMADIKYTYLQVAEEAVDIVKNNFRACKIIENRIVKGKNTVILKVWDGQSNFTKDEMKLLINKTLDYAEQVGLQTAFYREVLYVD